MSRDWVAEVNERTKRLLGISWGHGIVTHFMFKQTIRQGCDNKCIIRYIYGRQRFELLSIRFANCLIPLGICIQVTLLAKNAFSYLCKHNFRKILQF